MRNWNSSVIINARSRPAVPNRPLMEWAGGATGADGGGQLQLGCSAYICSVQSPRLFPLSSSDNKHPWSYASPLGCPFILKICCKFSFSMQSLHDSVFAVSLGSCWCCFPLLICRYCSPSPWLIMGFLAPEFFSRGSQWLLARLVHVKWHIQSNIQVFVHMVAFFKCWCGCNDTCHAADGYYCYCICIRLFWTVDPYRQTWENYVVVPTHS